MTDTATNEQAPKKKGGIGRLIAVLAVVIIGVGAAIYFGAFDYLTLDNLGKVQAWIEGLGWIGYAVFILLWIAACVFFLPGLPITIVGAIVFGPWKGSLLSSFGSTLGATCAFLVGRYAARDMVSGLVQKNKALAKIDDGVEKQGWMMLMITRLIPVFPFNAQNYVYGLTKISLPTYVLVSFLCMLPGCVAFNFLAGAIASGEMSPMQVALYVAGGAGILVGLSFLANWIKKKFGGEALAEDEAADS